MKSQKYGLAVILVLAVSWLPISILGNGEGQEEQDQARLLSIMKVEKCAEPAIGKELMGEATKSLAQQIAADFAAMRFLFETKDFCCLAELLEKRGVAIVTPAYKKIWGGSSAEFWKSVWKEGAKLDLVPVHIEISGAIGPQPVLFCDRPDRDITINEWMKKSIKYDAVAILIFEFHIVSKSGGTTLSNATGEAGGSYIHRTGCPWG